MPYNNANAVRRGPRDISSSLAEVGRQHGLSTEGAQYVAMACDPFSDERQPVIGLPDQTGGKSVLYDIRRELPITKPASVSSPDPWDCHVALMPCMFNQSPTNNNIFGVMGDHGNCSVNTLGYLECGDLAPGKFWSALGQVITVNTVQNNQETFQEWGEYYGVSIPELMGHTDRARLISIGYELINETEDQYVSGAHTDYRCDANPNVSQAWFQEDPLFLNGANPGIPPTEYCPKYRVVQCFLPPNSVADAKQMGGVTRASSEGSLVIGCLDEYAAAAEPSTCGTVILHRTSPPNGGSAGGGLGDVVFGPRPWDAEGVNGRPTVQIREIPFLMSGTYATNLSTETKLRLVVHAVVEVFPGPGDSRMPLAKMCPPYDPVAMEYLSSLQTYTLPGYPVSWNSLGKFTNKLKWLFRKSTKLAGLVAPLAMAAPDPRVKAIGYGLAGYSALGKRRAASRTSAGKRPRSAPRR